MDYRLDVTKLKYEGLPPFEKRKETKVLFVNISDYSPRGQFLICTISVFVLYLLYGYLQPIKDELISFQEFPYGKNSESSPHINIELIFNEEHYYSVAGNDKKSFGWYVTLVQFAFYTIFAKSECLLTKNSERKVSIPVYLLLAFLTLGTMGFSNSSLMYLNYPTQVIFKCCKLIPVMIGSILIQNKTYKLIDFVAALCMCVGLSYFTLADIGISPSFNGIGVFMISCALVCDAAIGNVQEKFMNSKGASTVEVVLYSYSIGFCYLLAIMGITGDLMEGITICYNKPHLYWNIFLFSITGYLGVQVVLTLVRTAGALAAVTVTTCRKAVSIILSFLFFTKPFTIHYFWAGSIVVIGIYLNVIGKNQGVLSMLSSFVLNIKRLFCKRRPVKSIETTV